MQGLPRICTVSIEYKESSDVPDFSSLSTYISKHYGENSTNYKDAFTELYNLRKSALSSTEELTTLSTLKRYYSQLQLLKARFPMAEEQECSTVWVWEDINSGPVSHYDIKYEEAYVLFNIGCMHANLGRKEKRIELDSTKVACTHFQCSAWAFQMILDKYSPLPASDMDCDFLRMLNLLMLAQAHECVLEKSMVDQRRSGLVAKIAFQISDFYKQSQGMMKSENIQFFNSAQAKQWKKLIAFKEQMYMCLSYYYMALVAEEISKYGEIVAWMKLSKEKMDKCQKLLKETKSKEVEETFKFMSDVINGKLISCTKDNDFIYHDKIPESDMLPIIKGAMLLKGLPFDVNDPNVCGEDIFRNLVPLEIHVSASIYSEKKAEILREIDKDIKEKDDEIEEFLKNIKWDNLSLSDSEVPQPLYSCAAFISANPEIIETIKTIMQNISTVSIEVEESIEKLSNHMKSVKPDNENLKKWKDYQNEYLELLNNFEDGKESNNQLREAFSSTFNDFKKMNESIEKIIENLPSLTKFSQSSDIIEQLNECKRLRDKINEMKLQRTELYQQLKNDMLADELTQQLLSAKNESDKSDIIETGLKKHQVVIDYLKQNMAAQNKIMDAVIEHNAKIADVRTEILKVKNERKSIVTKISQSFESHENLLSKGNEAINFYEKLNKQIMKLHTQIQQLFPLKTTSKLNMENNEPDIIKQSQMEVSLPDITNSNPKPVYNNSTINQTSFIPIATLSNETIPQSHLSNQVSNTTDVNYVPKLKDYYDRKKGTKVSAMPSISNPTPTSMAQSSLSSTSTIHNYAPPIGSNSTINYTDPNMNYYSLPNSLPAQIVHPAVAGQMPPNVMPPNQYPGNNWAYNGPSNNLFMYHPYYSISKSRVPIDDFRTTPNFQYTAPCSEAGSSAYSNYSTLPRQQTFSTINNTSINSNIQSIAATSGLNRSMVDVYSNRNEFTIPQQQLSYYSNNVFATAHSQFRPVTLPASQSTSYLEHSFEVPPKNRFTDSNPNDPTINNSNPYYSTNYYNSMNNYTNTMTAPTTTGVYYGDYSSMFIENNPTIYLPQYGPLQQVQPPLQMQHNASLPQDYQQIQSRFTPHPQSQQPLQQAQHNIPQSLHNQSQELQHPQQYLPQQQQQQFQTQQYSNHMVHHQHHHQQQQQQKHVQQQQHVQQQNVIQTQNMEQSNSNTQVYQNYPNNQQNSKHSKEYSVQQQQQQQTKSYNIPKSPTNIKVEFNSTDLLSSSPISNSSNKDSTILEPKILTKEEIEDQKEESRREIIYRKYANNKTNNTNNPLNDNLILNKFITDSERFLKKTNEISDNTKLLEDYWNKLLTKEKMLPKKSAAVAKCCSMKNRSQDCVPYDENRVVLKDGKDDYVNASLITIQSENDCLPRFMTCQSPLMNTLTEFWTAIFEQGCELLVQLAPLSNDDDKSKSRIVSYWPESKHQSLTVGAKYDISVQSFKEKAGWNERILLIKNIKTNQSRSVWHFEVHNMGKKLPKSNDDFLQFALELCDYYRQQRSLTKPIAVCCSNGSSVSGVLVLLISALTLMEITGQIPDIDNLLIHMWSQRKNLLDDKHQLVFISKLLSKSASDILTKKSIVIGPGRKSGQTNPSNLENTPQISTQLHSINSPSHTNQTSSTNPSIFDSIFSSHHLQISDLNTAISQWTVKDQQQQEEGSVTPLKHSSPSPINFTNIPQTTQQQQQQQDNKKPTNNSNTTIFPDKFKHLANPEAIDFTPTPHEKRKCTKKDFSSNVVTSNNTTTDVSESINTIIDHLDSSLMK